MPERNVLDPVFSPSPDFDVHLLTGRQDCRGLPGCTTSRQMSSDLLLILLTILVLMHSVMVYMLPVAVEDGTYLKKHFSGILPISRS